MKPCISKAAQNSKNIDECKIWNSYGDPSISFLQEVVDNMVGQEKTSLECTDDESCEVSLNEKRRSFILCYYVKK